MCVSSLFTITCLTSVLPLFTIACLRCVLPLFAVAFLACVLPLFTWLVVYMCGQERLATQAWPVACCAGITNWDGGRTAGWRWTRGQGSVTGGIHPADITAKPVPGWTPQLWPHLQTRQRLFLFCGLHSEGGGHARMPASSSESFTLCFPFLLPALNTVSQRDTNLWQVPASRSFVSSSCC